MTQKFGYTGDLYAINPSSEAVQGFRAYPTLEAIGHPVDLAIVAVPAALVPQVVADALRAEVRNLVLFASGYAELGPKGDDEQKLLARTLRDSGIRLLGPNCLGFINVAQEVYATFTPTPLVGRVPLGRVGVVSQSGAFGVYAYAMARERGMGLSLWVTTGNEADIQFADALSWLVQDPGTDVIMGYMEGCRDGPRLRAALAQAQAAGKPVIMVKVGQTSLGAEAAASHTASLAGDDAAYDAVFRRYGVLRARNMTEFFTLAHSAAVAGRPSNRRIALYSLSGGVAALMADAATQHGLEVPPLSDLTQERLRELVPFAATRNPVDITGQVANDPQLMEQGARTMMNDQSFGAWIGFMVAAGTSDAYWPALRQMVASLREAYPDRVLALSTLLSPARRAELEAMRCLVFADPSEGIRTIAALCGPCDPADEALPEPAVLAGEPITLPPGMQVEPEGLALLAAAGVPVVAHRWVRSDVEAADAARAMQAAVALKIVSADIGHKSDVGGVALGLLTSQAAADAYTRLQRDVKADAPLARLDGALVARMESGGIECIAGVRRDPVFGPLLVFGLGGIHAEIFRDVAVRVLPIRRAEVHQMIREIRGFGLLNGARGRPPADLEALADALCALATFAERAGPTLESAEVNPLLVRAKAEGGCVALDALVTGRDLIAH